VPALVRGINSIVYLSCFAALALPDHKYSNSISSIASSLRKHRKLQLPKGLDFLFRWPVYRGLQLACLQKNIQCDRPTCDPLQLEHSQISLLYKAGRSLVPHRLPTALPQCLPTRRRYDRRRNRMEERSAKRGTSMPMAGRRQIYMWSLDAEDAMIERFARIAEW